MHCTPVPAQWNLDVVDRVQVDANPEIETGT